MYLMLKDVEVLYFNLDEFVVSEIRPDLLPFSLRGVFSHLSDMKSLLYNIQMLKTYLSRRVLSLSRTNAKQIYALFRIPQLNDIETRVKICLACMGVSIQDSYWIKPDNSSLKFRDVNIRVNKFKEIVDISLDGLNPSITVNCINPELTTHGLFRKAWTRYDDGLYLLKSDTHSQNINTRMEVLASKILDCFSNKIECVHYDGRMRNTTYGKIYTSKCKSYARETHSAIEAWEIMEYCQRQGISYRDYILGLSTKVADIGVFDFILSNTDRHTQNYGFFMNNSTGLIEDIIPLFDLNLSLVSDLLGVDTSNTLSQMFNDSSTLLQVANYYKPLTNIKLDETKLKELRYRNKEYSIVFDNVLKRYDYLHK